MGKVCTWPARLANDFQALVAVPLPAGPCPVAVARCLCRCRCPGGLSRLPLVDGHGSAA